MALASRSRLIPRLLISHHTTETTTPKSPLPLSLLAQTHTSTGPRVGQTQRHFRSASRLLVLVSCKNLFSASPRISSLSLTFRCRRLLFTLVHTCSRFGGLLLTRCSLVSWLVRFCINGLSTKGLIRTTKRDLHASLPLSLSLVGNVTGLLSPDLCAFHCFSRPVRRSCKTKQVCTTSTHTPEFCWLATALWTTHSLAVSPRFEELRNELPKPKQ